MAAAGVVFRVVQLAICTAGHMRHCARAAGPRCPGRKGTSATPLARTTHHAPQGGDDAYGDRPVRRQKVQPLPAAQAAYAAALAASAASAGPVLRCELCEVRGAREHIYKISHF